jgi:hypothetical protein
MKLSFRKSLYIYLTTISKITFEMKNFIFKSFFWISILLCIPLALFIDVCESEGYSSNLISNILAISALFLLLEFTVYLVDIFVFVIKRIFKFQVVKSEWKCFVLALLLGVSWLFLNAFLSENGNCDLIMGPADSGLCLAMGISILINYWKIQILRKKEITL